MKSQNWSVNHEVNDANKRRERFFIPESYSEEKRRERAEFDSVNTKIWKSHIGRFVNAGVGVNNVFLGGEAEFERRMEAPAHGTTQQVFDVGKRCAVNAYNALMGLPRINHEVKDEELNDLVNKIGLNILDRDSSPFPVPRQMPPIQTLVETWSMQ